MHDPGTTSTPTVLGRRGDAHWARARGSLAQGRHADALEAVRRARRHRSAEEAPLLALVEGDALLGLQRYGDAVGVATRALGRGPLEPDLQARLRILRGHGLWLAGRVKSGGTEVRRAAGEARLPLTRGRAHETLALFAWKGQDLDRAAEHVRSAHEAYADAGRPPAALARVLAKEAGVLRDLGRLDEALLVQDRRLQAATGAGRGDLAAEARTDRAGLLAALGRWDEAAREIEVAGDLFARVGRGPEATGLTGVVVDLARGDLPQARARIAAARDRMAERGNVRGLAEALLLESDLHLAARQPEDADRTATESLDLYRVVRDAEGQCRSRTRRAHALLEMGRVADAALEARRALSCAAPSRRDLAALGHLALGRVLLRTDRPAAADAFDRARAAAGPHPAFAAAAAMGGALARGASRDDETVRAGVAALEVWGDRRILALCLADLADFAPAPMVGGTLAAERVAEAAPSHAVTAAAAALLEEGAWADRWVAAMRALRPVLPWWRAALVGDPALELRGDLDRAVPLPRRDLARDLAAAGAAGVVDLDAGEWAAHPTRVLHGLRAAVLAPAWPGAMLYADLREGTPSAEGASALADVARLLACRPPDPAPSPAGTAFPGIVGECPALRDLLATLARVAPSDLTVHVSGETGTGKEAIAKALHARSRRARGPFVAVNASSLGDELFEAEMFGHGRGAFTGAVGEREGYVAAAEGGTLFLDEVADLTPRAQARLLRFLEEREYRRLGETKTRRADVRVVTAANAPLACRLRRDLVFRLEEIVLTLPPLRERGPDVWLLVRHFLAEAARSAGVPVPSVSVEARRALATHSWPGNVRELRGEMRRAVVLAGGETVRREHLGEALRVAAPPAGRGLREALASFERDYLARELARNGGRRARTAVTLGITRQALAAKMARLGL